MRSIIYSMRSAIACAVMLGPAVARAQGPWEQVSPGIRYRTFRSQPGAGGFAMSAVQVDPSVARLGLVAVVSMLQERRGAYAYSLSEVAAATRAVAAINGGMSSSFSVPLPVGLLKVDGQTALRLNTRDAALTGVLCLQERRVRIVRREAFRPTECTQALQAGPVLVESPGGAVRVGEVAMARTPVRRSAVAVDAHGTVFLVATEPTRLDALAEFLARDVAHGGLGAVTALNLSGSTDSGLLVRRRAGTASVGTPRSTIASAIVVR